MKQKPSGKLTATILSISLLTVMAGAAIAPALGVISAHFSNCSKLTVQLIVTLPSLFIIFSNLLFESFCRSMKTRTLALVGLLLYVLAGAGAFLVDNIVILLILRAILGISVGMIMPLSTGLLAYYFPPEKQAGLMGLSAAMNQFGGVVATLLSGLLAGISWNLSFLVYLLGLIAVVMVIAFLPNESLVKAKSKEKVDSLPKRLWHFFPSVSGMLLVMILFFIYPTNFALTARSNPEISANFITLLMVGLDFVAFLVGLAFGKVMKLTPKAMKYIGPVGFICGYACLAAGVGRSLLIIGSAVIGLANGLAVPYLNTIASIKGGKNAATTVMPLISAALYLGQFISPLVVGPLSRLFDSVTAPYKVGIAIALVYLLQALLTRKRQALPPAAGNNDNQ